MNVVTTSRPMAHVAVIELADRVHRNQLTEALVRGLSAQLAEAQSDPQVRVIVVHGYDSYFCTGGTQKELLGIFHGELQFDQVPLYRMFLDCPLPVIAAMQGHALGGGLAIGLFADLIVLAEESVYSANFMRYGFTPGMGATLVVPEKFGPVLGTEMLLSANGYQGAELARRGAGAVVARRKDVIPKALQLASDLAAKPRLSLELLKRHLAAPLAAKLPATVQAELAMHQVTFAQPEVRGRIESLFSVGAS